MPQVQTMGTYEHRQRVCAVRAEHLASPHYFQGWDFLFSYFLNRIQEKSYGGKLESGTLLLKKGATFGIDESLIASGTQDPTKKSKKEDPLGDKLA